MPSSNAEKMVKKGASGMRGKESTVQAATKKTKGMSGRRTEADKMASGGKKLPDSQGR